MSKKDHDDRAAMYFRIVNYQKGWYQHGLNVLKELNMENFAMLDLGCGNGEFSEMAKDRFNADITCMDYTEEHLKRVKHLGFKTIKCDFDSNEDVERVNKTYKKSFDIIVSFEVIEHVFDVDTFLSTVHNILKDNSIFLISTPNIAYIGYRIYSLFRGNLPVGEGHHIRFFNPRRLKQILILNGFDFLGDYSFGKGGYYLDRAVGEKILSFRSFYIKALMKLWSFFTPKTSLSFYSGLLFAVKKADVSPVGLDPGHREVVFDRLSIEEKKKVINRLLPLRRMRFFDEHPGLRKFIDKNSTVNDFGRFNRD